MRKHLKKAVSFMMAVCLLAGNSYVDTRANTSVTMTEWVEEVPESSAAGTEVAETEVSVIDTELRTASAAEATPTPTPGNDVVVSNGTKYVFFKNDETNTFVESGETVDLNSGKMTLIIKRLDQNNNPVPMEDGSYVEWVSGNTAAVQIQNSTLPNGCELIRTGPGLALVVANICNANGVVQDTITCLIKVGIRIVNDQDSEWKIFPDGTSNKILVLEKKGDYTYPVKLEHMSEDELILGNEVLWSCDREGVIDIEDGVITPLGAGTTTVTIKTRTVEGGKSLELKFDVVVMPEGAVVLDNTCNTYEGKVQHRTKENELILYSNGNPAKNIQWEVYQVLYDKQNLEHLEPITPSNTELLSYEISEDNGEFRLDNLKAGTYRIIGYVDKGKYGTDVTWNKVQYDFVVGINLNDRYPTISMNVDDIYNVIANSNIPERMFSELFDIRHHGEGDNAGTEIAVGSNVVSVSEDGYITGLAKGTAKVLVSYKGEGLKALDRLSIFSDEDTENYKKQVVYPFEIIDGLSLNSTLLTLYEGQEFQLKTTTTDTATVVWTSSDTSKVTVTQTGLIKAIKTTNANEPVLIAATQMINGVEKRIVCKVFVQPAVTEIILQPEEKLIDIEEFLTIEAVVKPEVSDVDLRWISSDSEVVAISSASNRSVTVQGMKGGSAVITAINAQNIVVGHCKVTVNQPAEELILSAGGKNLSDGEEVRVPWSDKTFQLYAEILPEETTNKEVTWKSSNPKLATVDEHGLVTFNKSGKAGEVTIIVQSKDNPNLVKTCTIRILASVNGVELDQHELNLFVGESERLTYLVNPDDVANKTVTWTSFDTSIAAVDKTGMVTAKGPGKTQIMIMTEDGSFYDLCTVTVDLYATSVKMNYKKVTMNRGDYFDMEVTVAPANSTVKSLIWESLNPSVVTVSSNGRLTARNVGTAIVMVKTQTGSLAYCEVTVLEPMVSLELDETDITIDVDEKFLLTPEFSPEEPSNTEVKWSTSDEDIAEVNLLGEVTGISGGTVVITCETVDGGYRAFCLVTVEEPVYELTVTPDNYRLGIGKTYQLTATMTNKGTATDSEIIWSSSDESICTVDKFGKITGVNFGYATIKAEAADGYGAYATCEVRVVREVTSIRLNYYRIQLVQGETVSLRAEIQPSNATYNTAQFVSDDLTVAVVDEDGLITGITPGTTWVHANAKDNSGVSAACFVEVIAPIPATGVTVSDKEIVLVPGESKEVIASIRPANSTDDLTWSSGNEFIATVDSNGKITARMVGTTDVTVMTTSGKTATVKVIVLGLSRSTLEMPVYTQYSRLVVDGANAPVRWDVEDTTICEIANGVVTARKVGTTYVTATINGRTLKCKIIVSPNKKK
ncbi:MAG: Ig-like domain-containing protein [Lachnospiraceae bacterium]|nr:Ig-like domain-containing protein [Lachnospiraceae bacterium]